MVRELKWNGGKFVLSGERREFEDCTGRARDDGVLLVGEYL